MDFESGIFTCETVGELDFGFDYYAAQSMLDEAGNRVLIAWQNGWSWMPWWHGFGPTDAEGWRGCMTLPRVASLLEDGKLCLTPIRQLEQLRYAPVCYESMTIGKDRVRLHPVDGTSFEWKLEAGFERREGSLELRIRDNGTSFVAITIDLQNKLLVLDVNTCDPFSQGKRSCKLELKNNRLDLDIWIDKSSVEIFADNGATCMTSNIYPDENQIGTSICTLGGDMIVDRMQLYSIRDCSLTVI
jgi:beta-fructofuranosidase